MPIHRLLSSLLLRTSAAERCGSTPVALERLVSQQCFSQRLLLSYPQTLRRYAFRGTKLTLHQHKRTNKGIGSLDRHQEQ
jgi:hypothetical protein